MMSILAVYGQLHAAIRVLAAVAALGAAMVLPAAAASSSVQPSRPPDKIMVFKNTPQGDLTIHGYFPRDWKLQDKRPAIVFWFGGAFKGGAPKQFYAKAEYLASRGMVGFCAEYRVKGKHGIGIDKCVEDARSAVRWIKGHAGELGVDHEKVIVSGGSSGGTLSLLVGLGTGPDAADDDSSISPKPCAMVLFNPAHGKFVASRETIESQKAEMLKQLAAIDKPQKGQPPAIFFFGTADKLMDASRTFCRQALALGARCEMWTAEGEGHGFFNQQPWHDATLRKVDEFLASLGYLQGPPEIKASPEAVLQTGLPEK